MSVSKGVAFMKKTIKVTGKGKLSVKPDLIRLILSMEETHEKYEDTVQASATASEKLRDLFEDLGFKRSCLKTLYFNINTEYEGYYDENKNWKQRFKGYKFEHRMKLEFPEDNKILGRVIYALGQSETCPEFNIEYTVADAEAAKNSLLKKAVSDSRTKAQILCEAADVKLGCIKSIDYSWGEIDLVSRPADLMVAGNKLTKMCEKSAGYDIDINPDDIEITDTVTVVWEIS